MKNIEITFLGTGNAIPTPLRNHTSILVSFENENILFDCGEGTQRQLKIAKISPTKITRIFITHWHGDHILGIPGILQTLYMSNYQKTLEIYGPIGTKRNIELIRSLLMNLRIDFRVHEIESGQAINEKDFYIEALPMTHGPPTLAYALTIKEKIRIDKVKLKKLKLPNSPELKKLTEGKDIIIEGRKIKASQLTYKEKSKKVTIIMDTSLNNNAIKLGRDSNLIIAESTFSSKDKEKAKEYNHLTAKEAAEIARKSKSKQLILTHISQRYEHYPKKIEKEAREIFKNTLIAKDFDKVKI